MKVHGGLLIFLQFLTVYSSIVTPEFETELRSFINASMECRLIPGMTLAVVKGDEVWTRGYGMADLSTGRTVDEQTVFNLASITKSFTAALLGILLNETGHTWSTKVTDILGNGYAFVDDYRTKELMVRDLLSHRTGLGNLDEGLIAGFPEHFSRADLCKNLRYLPEKRPVRDGWWYSNYLYMMLGHVAEVLGNDTYENLVTSRIFEPLGMNSTWMLKKPADVLKADVAIPYSFRDGEFQNGTSENFNYHPYEPAIAIMSTATDMTKWIKFNLKKGKTETGDQLIDMKLIDDMQWPTATYDSPMTLGDRFLTKPKYPVDEIQLGYGYGWGISVYRGYKMAWHSGRAWSYATMFAFYPDKDIGMFASVNGPAFKVLPDYHLTTLLYHISDQLLDLEPWLNETTACTFPEPWANKTETKSKEPEVPITVENKTYYEGEFSHPLFNGVEVSTNSTTMFIKAKPRLSGILHPSSEKDRFLWQITNPWEVAVYYTDNNNVTRFINITFLRDDNGDVKAFKAGFDVDLTFTKNGYVSGSQHVTMSAVYIVLAATLANIFVCI